MDTVTAPPSPTTGALLLAAVSTLATVAGAGNSLLSRVVQAQACAAACSATPGAPPPTFTKPVFVTAVAFGAMSVSLLLPALSAALRCATRACTRGGGTVEARERALQARVFEGDEELLYATPVKLMHVVQEPPPPSWYTACARYAVLVVPTLLDVTATGLQNAAVLFIPAGVAASMRGSLLLFAALAATGAGGGEARAGRGEWVGIALSVCGSTLAGVSTLLNSGGGGDEDGEGRGGLVSLPGWTLPGLSALGLSLSLLSNAVQGGQVAIETALLKGNVFTPAETNGVEGVMGVALLLALLALFQAIPGGGDNGHVEDSVTTLCCLTSGGGVAGATSLLAALFLLSTTAYMALSSLRGGNYRALLMVSRSLLVWLAELCLWYGGGGERGGGHQQYGQPFRKYDWLQGVGFLVLLWGGVLTCRAQTEREARGVHPFAREWRSGSRSPGDASLGYYTPAGHGLLPGEDTLDWGRSEGGRTT